MKLYAQHGFSNGNKTLRGVRQGYVDGVIYSPRDIAAPRLQDHIRQVAEVNGEAEQFFDPQYYAAYNVNDPEARLGRLDSCEEYEAYFRQRRRRELEGGTELLRGDIWDCLVVQEQFDLTGVIGPNILISRSFDSIEAVISKNFIRQAAQVHAEAGCAKPLYVTLAVSREALMDQNELLSFLTDITILDDPPDGFYVLVAARSDNARSDIFNADVIASWLLINHTLSHNGYEMINGYSDLLTPFLGAAGATAGATGWWSNLRVFSLNRFLPARGGRLPVQRYVSKPLLNRITHFELSQVVELKGTVPGIPNVLNDLTTDSLYPADRGFEPERPDEVLQTWDAVSSLCEDLCRDDLIDTLCLCKSAVNRAVTAYDAIKSQIRLDPKSNDEHLAAIAEGLRLYERLAEIDDERLHPG